jgi:hypothetical protein
MATSRALPAASPRSDDGANPQVESGLRQGAATAKKLAVHYDQLIDAMNRLPRPVLMILTVALFGYAAFDPAGFAARMEALAEVPEPLWWMQGAIVTFYFGAREAHYIRQTRKPASKASEAAETP